MGRFDLKTETIHADWWDEGETVTITELTWEKMQDLQRYAMQEMTLPGNRKEARRRQTKYSELDFKELAVQTMVASIVAWTFTQNGQPVLLSDEYVRKLSQADGDFITEAIDALNPERDDDFQSGRRDGLHKRQGESGRGADPGDTPN